MSDPAQTAAGDGQEHEPLPTLEAIECEGRRVLVRVDINAPVEDGKVLPSARLRAAGQTLRALVDRGAGVVVLAHQGRPGRADFTSLEQHAALLADETGLDISFTPHVDDDQALEAVQAVEPGQVLLLDNVRGAQGEIENAEPEVHAGRQWVRRLAGEVEAFVLDAFPAAHRSHASIVGFPLLLPSCVGPLVERELEALARAGSIEADGDRLIVLGGAKVEDALQVLHHHLEDDLIDQALLGGLVGELFLIARGHELGGATDRVLERTGAMGYRALAERLVETYDYHIVTPLDVAFTDGGDRHDIFIEELPAKGKVLDIGPEAARDFADRIAQAGTVVLNGPMGAYEQEGFDLGTRTVLEACARTEAFTLLGGGHTVQALEDAGLDPSDFDHVSLAGGALVTYLTGEPLPGLQALVESKRKFALASP